jgi:hypothetical protein
MKKLLVILSVFLLFLGFTGIASAAYFEDSWEDYDRVGYYVGEGDTDFYYGLNISIADDFRPGIDYVTSAKLWFWLDDDSYDDAYEYAYVWSPGAGWNYAGEVDQNEVFGSFSVAGGGLWELNTFGTITVGVYSDSLYDRQVNDFNWQGAKVEAYGYRYEPVPEPATMFLLGTGLIGLVGAGRKKFFKK